MSAVVELVGDVVEAVGDAVSDVADAVGNTIEKALDDPIGTIAKVAAIATEIGRAHV